MAIRRVARVGGLIPKSVAPVGGVIPKSVARVGGVIPKSVARVGGVIPKSVASVTATRLLGAIGRPHWDRELGLPGGEPGQYERDLVFVIMSFISAAKRTYTAIKAACEGIQLKAVRVDEVAGSGLIIKDIVSLISRAEFIVCDLTYERPNVYYELGYAHGVGNYRDNVLLIAKKGTRLHFDIAALGVKYYNSTRELRTLVSAKLSEMKQRHRQAEKRSESPSAAAPGARLSAASLAVAMPAKREPEWINHLSAAVRAKGSLSTNGYAWQAEDVEEAINDARVRGLVILRGQAEFRASDGTYDFYSVPFEAASQRESESWADYVKRSADETISQFRQRIANTDWDRAIRGWALLHAKVRTGIEVMKRPWFVLNFDEGSLLDR